MRVGLVTSWGVRCGIAEYALHLTASCPDVFPLPLQEYSLSSAWAFDVVHLNYEAGLFRCFPTGDLYQLRAAGKKLVLTLHNSTEGVNRSSFTDLFDRVIVHEHTRDSGNFVHIPMGIPASPLARKIDPYVGIAGFPFNWKGFHPTAMAAYKFGLGCLAIMPESSHVDTAPMQKVVMESNYLSKVITTWLPESKVIEELAACLFLAFPYEGGNSGISGAVRMGLAARRPIILSRCRQFRDLFAYEDEIYFADAGLWETMAQVLSDLEQAKAKVPARVLEDMAWSKVGEMHHQVYESLF